jgi:Holliday junction resolvasome RuvABC DNA-binding subunit
MITTFDDFLNESDEIRKRIEDRLKKSFDILRAQHGVAPRSSDKPEGKKRELKIRPKKEGDTRLKDAYNGLKSLHFSDKDIKDFIDRIEELYPETTTTEIVERGIKELSAK